MQFQHKIVQFLILDNHVSHVSYEAVTHAKKKFIHMLSLPPHTSHKTQPLDRVFFRPLKANYDVAIDNWLSSHAGQVVTTYHIAEIFKVAYERTATIEKASEAFKATGIFPLDT
uniref:DDE-1 domain-containing protein n=1 Tax=Cacopsylla melanoneura TaxID=428564 RepID=A0A8D8QYF3_9HEMI